MRLGALFYPGFEMLDVYGPLEMFAMVESGLEIVAVAERAGPVAPLRGPATLAEVGYADCPNLDLLLVPGGVGTLNALGDEALLDFLRRRAREARVVMSVCTGSALLARAGLLDGRRATSNKQFFKLATDQSGAVDWVSEARWVEDGPFVTSSGVSAGMDMALAVIEKQFGVEEARQIAERTEYTRHTDPDRDPFARLLNASMGGGEASNA